MRDAGGVRRHVASNPDVRLNPNFTFRGFEFLPQIGRRCPGFLAGALVFLPEIAHPWNFGTRFSDFVVRNEEEYPKSIKHVQKWMGNPK